MVPNPLPAPNAVPISLAIPVSVSVSVSVPPSFTLALALSFALLLPLSFFLPFFFSLRLSCSSLGLSLLLFGALLPLGDFSALTGDFFLHGLQVGILLVALGTSRTDIGSVFLVCLCAMDTFFFCRILANLGLSKFADLLFDCADVDETFEEGFSLPVDTRSIQRTVDESNSFSAVECQQLGRVSFDFLLGDFEHRLRNLLTLILPRVVELATALSWRMIGVLFSTYTGLERIPDLFARRIIASLLLEGVGKSIDGCPSRRGKGQLGRLEPSGMSDGRSIGHLRIAFSMLVASRRCEVGDCCCHRGGCQFGSLRSGT